MASLFNFCDILTPCFLFPVQFPPWCSLFFLVPCFSFCNAYFHSFLFHSLYLQFFSLLYIYLFFLSPHRLHFSLWLSLLLSSSFFIHTFQSYTPFLFFTSLIYKLNSFFSSHFLSALIFHPFTFILRIVSSISPFQNLPSNGPSSVSSSHGSHFLLSASFSPSSFCLPLEGRHPWADGTRSSSRPSCLRPVLAGARSGLPWCFRRGDRKVRNGKY